MNNRSVNQLTVLLLVALVSVIFTMMIRGYIMTLLLAGVFASMTQPMFRWFLDRLPAKKKSGEQNRGLASALTMLVFVLIVIIPLAVILSIVVVQAVQVGQTVGPWIQESFSEPAQFIEGLEQLPFYELLVRYQDDLLNRLGQLVSSFSNQLVNSISQFTAGTVQAAFLLFIFLYSMFFFIKDGEKLLNIILYYLPLSDEPERKLLDHFTSVTRATMKGTLLIGLIQGTAAALGFWVAGIQSVVFWGLVMTVLSIIPVIGASIVWIPAVIVLAVGGKVTAAIVLGLYCALLVGSIDNILRPILVGKDTKMHELLILLSTLGGIGLFGIWGFLIGPVIAALFVSIWDLYGKTFAEYLPEVLTALPSSRKKSVKDSEDDAQAPAPEPKEGPGENEEPEISETTESPEDREA